MLTHKKVRIIFVVYGVNRKSLRHNLFFDILQFISITKQLNWLHCFQFEWHDCDDTIDSEEVYNICINVLFLGVIT